MTSQINQVKDQLFIDRAEGKYLNVVTGNYGFFRPLMGFSDDVWRSVAKVLAVQYKQIASKFRDVLEVVVGPDTSRVANLIYTAYASETVLYAHSTDHLPDTGTLVLDKGQYTEETVSYKFIDRKANSITLASPLTYTHSYSDTDSAAYLLDVSGSEVLLSSTDSFSTSLFPYSVCLSRAKDEEETAVVTANDISTRVLTLNAAASNGVVATLGYSFTALSSPYVSAAYHLSVDSVDEFPESGMLVLGRSDNTFSVSSFAGSTITLGSPTFSRTNNLSGYKVVFLGNATPSLANVEYYIEGNTTTNIVLFRTPGTAPIAGDNFKIVPVVEYTSKSYNDNTFSLKYTIDPAIDLPADTRVSYLLSPAKCELASVFVQGVDWEVRQVSPRRVEIYAPTINDQLQGIFEASRLHAAKDPAPPSTTVAVNASIGDIILEVGSTAGFPQTGTLLIAFGTGFEERIGYSVASSTQFSVPFGLEKAHVSPQAVTVYQPSYTLTNVLKGDPQASPYDVFPGPYLYDDTQQSVQPAVVTSLSQHLSASTKLALDATAGLYTVEVEDASLIVDQTGVSINMEGETPLTLDSVSLKSRCLTTVAGAGATAGLTTAIDCGSLSDGGFTGSGFPDSNSASVGFRVVINPGTSTEEIAYVIAANHVGPQLSLESPVIYNHSPGEEIRLVRDVLQFTSPLAEDHDGSVPSRPGGVVAFADRVQGAASASGNSEALIPEFRYSDAEEVYASYSSIQVASTTGFASSGGYLLLDYGNTRSVDAKDVLGSAASPSDTSLTLSDSTGFPTVYPYVIQVDAGKRFAEKLTVSNNNTGTGVLTLSTSGSKGRVRYAHDAGAKVILLPTSFEAVPYSGVTNGTTLAFSPDLVVQSNHQIGESVHLSTDVSAPQDDGSSYPFRVPVDFFDRLVYLFDLVRAAGIEVVFV